MNAADLARLELAKRAYKATPPNEIEIQTGVRRARLSLGRPKARRAWFSKGLVFVALAVGSLAYAKPHVLGELVENVLPRADAGAKRGVGTGAALSLPTETSPAKSGGRKTPSSSAATVPTATPVAAPATDATPVAAPATEPAPAKKQVRSSAQAVAAPAELPAADAAAAVSDWGRVGQALAKGDETQALAALAELSESDDQRTRDKADLGRAQLLMAHGDHDEACSLARSLTNRRAGGRIERQAQALLKTCTR